MDQSACFTNLIVVLKSLLLRVLTVFIYGLAALIIAAVRGAVLVTRHNAGQRLADAGWFQAHAVSSRRRIKQHEEEQSYGENFSKHMPSRITHGHYNHTTRETASWGEPDRSKW